MSTALRCICHRCHGRLYRTVTAFLAAHGGRPPSEPDFVDAPDLVLVPHQQLRLFDWEQDGSL